MPNIISVCLVVVREGVCETCGKVWWPRENCFASEGMGLMVCGPVSAQCLDKLTIFSPRLLWYLCGREGCPAKNCILTQEKLLCNKALPQDPQSPKVMKDLQRATISVLHKDSNKSSSICHSTNVEYNNLCPKELGRDLWHKGLLKC